MEGQQNDKYSEIPTSCSTATGLLKLASSKDDYEDVADEIYRLREHKQRAQLENAGSDELRKRISDMSTFLLKHLFIVFR